MQIKKNLDRRDMPEYFENFRSNFTISYVKKKMQNKFRRIAN